MSALCAMAVRDCSGAAAEAEIEKALSMRIGGSDLLTIDQNLCIADLSVDVDDFSPLAGDFSTTGRN